jgi:signal transduction histidine kinase
MTSQREDRVLLVVGTVVLGIVGVSGSSVLYRNGGPWQIAAALLLAFGILQFRIPPAGAGGRSPHLYLAAQASLVVALLALESEDTLFAFLFFILSPQAMLLLPHWRGVAWVGAFVVASTAFVVRAYGWPDALFPAAAYAAGFFFFGVVAHAVNRADASRRESHALLTELQEAHHQLQEYAMRIEDLAVAEERNRLAREMHDTLGHRLTVAAVQLEGAQRLIGQDPTRAADMVGTVRDQVREALSELRRTVATLRAPIEEDLHLRQSLRRLATHFEEATGVTVHLMLPEERPELPDAYRIALYRVAQEALTNVQRHAQAKDVWLQLTQKDGAVALLVGDNGVGLGGGQGAPGFGLRGLRERAAQMGGEFYVEPRPGGGTQLSFRVPLSAEDGDG